jgi:hypothetical protein
MKGSNCHMVSAGLCVLWALVIAFLAIGCVSETARARKYPSVVSGPSPRGSAIEGGYVAPAPGTETKRIPRIK